MPGTYKLSVSDRLLWYAFRDSANGSLAIDVRVGASGASQLAEYTDAAAHLSKGSFMMGSVDGSVGAWLVSLYLGVRFSHFWASAGDASAIKKLSDEIQASNAVSGVGVISLAQLLTTVGASETAKSMRPVFLQAAMTMSPGHFSEAVWSLGLTGVFEPF